MFLLKWRFLQKDKLGFVYPIVGANCVRPPDCHSEPISEEYRVVYFYFVLLEILRFAQDDKLEFVGEFRNGQDRSLRTKCIFRVGRGLAPAAGFAVKYGTDKL